MTLPGVTVKVYVADLATETIQDPVSIRAYHTQTIAEFKETVSEVRILDANFVQSESFCDHKIKDNCGNLL